MPVNVQNVGLFQGRFKIQIRPVIFRGIMRKTSALILPISPGREAAA
jgi:hypothetical protein